MHLENLSNNNFVGDTNESGKIDISKKSLLVILISTFTKLKLPFWEHAFSCYDFNCKSQAFSGHTLVKSGTVPGRP